MEGQVKGLPSPLPRRPERRLSLEEKILRLARRYRLAEKRRLRRQNAIAKNRCSHARCHGCRLDRVAGKIPPSPFERAARVPFENTLVWTTSAAWVPMAPGLVAGRLLCVPAPICAEAEVPGQYRADIEFNTAQSKQLKVAGHDAIVRKKQALETARQKKSTPGY